MFARARVDVPPTHVERASLVRVRDFLLGEANRLALNSYWRSVYLRFAQSLTKVLRR